MKLRRISYGLVMTLFMAVGRAGVFVEIRDLQYASQEPLIFPQAEIKLLAFQFESASADPRGRDEAKALHDTFLRSISDVAGAAIVTFVLPSGSKPTNYRDSLKQAAQAQHAQLVVWGTVLADAKGNSRTNIHLVLFERPPGVQGEYQTINPRYGSARIRVRGVIDAPVTLDRIDFTTITGDVTPTAQFMAGLVRYYKASSRTGAPATRWLRESVSDFEHYLATPSAQSDASAAAQAHLYIARAAVRLATSDVPNAIAWFERARTDAARAAELNPYSAEAPTLQGVIAVGQHRPLSEVAAYLTRALGVSPLDTNVRMNSAVLTSAQASPAEALRQVSQTTAVFAAKGVAIPESVKRFRSDLERQNR